MLRPTSPLVRSRARRGGGVLSCHYNCAWLFLWREKFSRGRRKPGGRGEDEAKAEKWTPLVCRLSPERQAFLGVEGKAHLELGWVSDKSGNAIGPSTREGAPLLWRTIPR